jgi:hypothetical protein
MKRFLLACLGMLLLGSAGLLILRQLVDSPSAANAQPPGGPAGGIAVGPGAGGAPRQAPEPGQYKEVVPPLVEALADADGSVRQSAAATLVKIGQDALQPLTDALKAKDRETRANAAYVLGHLSQTGREALPALAKALKDDDKEVRRRAAYAIHNIVSRSETAAVVVAPRADDGGPDAGGGGLAGVALRGVTLAGPPGTGGLLAPMDPGLLLPPPSPPNKPEKEQK